VDRGRCDAGRFHQGGGGSGRKCSPISPELAAWHAKIDTHDAFITLPPYTRTSKEILCAIQALPPIAPQPGQARSIPERTADYFTTNAQRMRYPLFRARGMHIGSGIAEAACKTIVSTRAKRCGMRWAPGGLDALLPLRTAVLNEAYDSFWEEERVA
jgi:hypothetical protein